MNASVYSDIKQISCKGNYSFRYQNLVKERIKKRKNISDQSSVKTGFLSSQIFGRTRENSIKLSLEALFLENNRWQREDRDLLRLLTIAETKDFHRKLRFILKPDA